MLKKIIIFLLLIIPLSTWGQYTAPYTKAEQKAATKWAKKNAPWKKGFTKGKPGVVNIADFKRQYELNQGQWDALFSWLQNTNLNILKAGKYPIPGTSMTASVQDDENKPLSMRRSESHRKKIDFQFVVTGTEGFVLLNHNDPETKPNCEYDAKKDVIHYNYDPEQAWQFATQAPHFNIFFPEDWHVAKVETRKKDQHFRVIVIKVDYKE